MIIVWSLIVSSDVFVYMMSFMSSHRTYSSFFYVRIFPTYCMNIFYTDIQSLYYYNNENDDSSCYNCPRCTTASHSFWILSGIIDCALLESIAHDTIIYRNTIIPKSEDHQFVIKRWETRMNFDPSNKQSIMVMFTLVVFLSSHFSAIAAQSTSLSTLSNSVQMKVIIKASDKSMNASLNENSLRINANDIKNNQNKNSILSDFMAGFGILVAELFQELSLEGWVGVCKDHVSVGITTGAELSGTNHTATNTEVVSAGTGDQNEGDGLFRNLEGKGIKSSTLYSYSIEEKIGTLTAVDVVDICE